MSPTFAAGLGIVIAAMLVLPMTGTIFHYTLPHGSGESLRCPRMLCGPHGAGGAHAAIKGGKRIPSARPRHHAGPVASARATPPAGAPTPTPSSQESLRYQTVRQWPGGFIGQITISFAAGSEKDGWQLRFGYPTADIQGVWGGSWVPLGKHRARVTAGPSASAPPGLPVVVTFQVRGDPSAPARCTFNGQDCRLGG